MHKQGLQRCHRLMVHVSLCQGHSTSGSCRDTPCHALTTLARDAEFQAFALQRSLSYLQACQDHQPVIGAFTGVCRALPSHLILHMLTLRLSRRLT